MSVMPEQRPRTGRRRSAVGRDDVLGVRIAAALIDLAILSVSFVVVSAVTGGTATGAAVWLALAFLYHLVLESTRGRTLGKALLGLRIVGWDGGRPSVVAVAIRTMLRVVDWLPLLYVVGLVTMIATGARRQRLGDLAAETVVERTAPVRRRGLAAALLASALVVALAASLAPLVVLNGFTPTTSSSVCVDDRCNATVRGDQRLELADRGIAVSGIGVGRATFTVDGHTVALRVGETRRVGQSLVHLASVDGDVAKFSVDFSGLFSTVSDLTGEPGDEIAASASSTRVTDDRGVVTVEVPATWHDVDGRENAEYGPSVHAAPDLDGFRDTWDVPGIIVEVSPRHGPEDIGAVMRQLGPAEDCTSEGRETHDGRRYQGEVERWTGCGGTDTTVVSAALAPPDGTFLIRVLAQAVDASDVVAIDGALTTIEVGAHDDAEAGRIVSDDAEARPVLTADAWLRRIATVRRDIDSAIAGTDSELTTAVLDEMAAAMRTCSRELASTAPAGARLRPIRAQVDEACAEYDKGAQCLTTAADIGTTVDAGSADDRRLTEALDCGFDALNRGGELLVRAEIDAESVQPR